jgi:Tol biopolymer transport system component/tRNA A-37 threonylcarbamoyl transferase component Bud32
MNGNVTELIRLLADLSPEAREQYWAEHTVDERTRRDVEELLANDSPHEDHFSKLVGSTAMAMLRGDLIGSRCGPFRLVREIGRGGMGVVYLAERVDGEVKQRAAVKLMQPGGSEIRRDRFLQERVILAGLTHPNIAHLLDAGHLGDGQPYLAMEYVEGKPIHQFAEGFSIRAKIDLFLKVCAAVAYLHKHLVVHRDLKPSNILVPALGEPKLLDFGIAKMLDLETDRTATQLRMLTPDYASPEQMSGGAIGKSSDVYSLGAVLHYLLTGQRPGETRPEAFPPEMKGELRSILQRAMRPEPEERYATVEEFAEDLKAYLDSRPIRARRGDWAYRGKKFVRRHSIGVALSSARFANRGSVGGFGWYRLRPAPAIRDHPPRRLTANTPELPIQAGAISPDGNSMAYSDPLGIHVQDIARGETRLLAGTSGHVLVNWTPDGANLLSEVIEPNGATASMVIRATGGDPAPAAASDLGKLSPDRKRRAMVSSDAKALVIQDAAGGNAREIWRAPKGTVYVFAWSPDSKQIAASVADESITVLEAIDVSSGRSRTLVPAEKNLWMDSIVWPSQNRIIVPVYEAGAGMNSQGNTNLWEIRLNEAGAPNSGLHKLTAWTDFSIRARSLTTDGKKLMFVRSFRQRDVYVADLGSSRRTLGMPRRLTLDLGDDYPTAWTPDSRRVVLTSDRNGPPAIFLQDITKQTAEQLVTGPITQILPRVAPDRNSILFVGRHQGKRGLLRTPLNGESVEMLLEMTGIADYRCSPAGPCVITERKDGVTIVSELDLKKGKVREIYRDSSARYATPDLSPDGKWLAVSWGGKAVVRSFETGAIEREITIRGLPTPSHLVSMDFAPDGKGFFCGDVSPTETRLLYIDLSGKASVLWSQAGSSSVWGVPSPDGKYLAMMVFTDDSNVYMVENF